MTNRNTFWQRSFNLLALSLVLSIPVSFARAEVIEFPEEELSQESVLPRFDRPDVVRRRNVVTENKFEVGGYYGWNISEPIYNQSKIGFNAGYHLSEEAAIILNYAQWNSGLNTTYTDSLDTKYNLDFSRAPKLKYSLYAHYEWKIFYGKISMTKQSVMNLSTYPIFGGGITAYEHKNYPGVDFGIGQKFYFNQRTALRADFKLQYAQKPSPFLSGKMKSSDPVPSAADFDNKWSLDAVLDFGFSILL
ncbi:MAG: outer membrane beta-barrel domain-containing protein [Bdellovibrio sp. CG10_big_fil_rev_8_21_14_0_10_47_8]|nr:MAG: outer membrane beta-barrel domain-containing protein [Bdellovibrio sp. CG10_big_fil_rev_8_21_14_0_10_47_8]